MSKLPSAIRQALGRKGTGDYPEAQAWKAGKTKMKNAIKADAEAAGWALSVFSIGHMHATGFLEKDGRIAYFSFSDNSKQILIRTATSLKDYSGGTNHYADLDGITEFLEKF